MFVTIGQAKIFATSFGSRTAPALLAIGGWIGSWELWVEPFSILSQTWHTIAYDHRGAGATVAPLDSVTFDTLVDDVFAVLDAYEVDQCVLAAESAGALTALGAALKRPERIRGLVIVDGSYFSPDFGKEPPFVTGLRADYPTTLKRFIDACVPEPDSDHIKRWGLQILDRASPEAAIALYLMPGGVDLRHDFHRITQPALILHGDKDALVPLEAAQWLVTALPNATLKVLKETGHVPTVTRPREVAEEIVNFFRPPVHL